MYDVVALGELLVDCTSNQPSEQGNPQFEANPGGAPCNVLAMLTQLGHNTAFIGKVGEDVFGRFLRETITKVGIDDAGLVSDTQASTTMALVHTAPDGDRDFSFFRKPGADTLLQSNELPEELLQSCRIFLFGSLSLTHEPSRSATAKAVALAKQSGAMLSFDPNLRRPLWDDLAEARTQIEWGCLQCDILKISDEELEFLTGSIEIEDGVRILREKHPNIKLLLVTQGKHGARAFYKDIDIWCPTCTEVKTIDTTGAGDTFCGCCLHFILSHGIENLNEAQLKEMLQFANAAASLVTTKKGAILSMPTVQEVDALIKNTNAYPCLS